MDTLIKNIAKDKSELIFNTELKEYKKTYLQYFPLSELEKVNKNKKLDYFEKLELLSFLLRLNILYSIQVAGSGHLGSSLSALDIFLCCDKYLQKNKGHFFSSKGHDAPALYNVLISSKKLRFNNLHKLRKLNGLPGHPDVDTKNIIFNTGSLGMGISKINGLCYSSILEKKKNKNIVILGDGELQEGQNWEGLMYLQNHKKISPLIFIDNNGIQSDTWVKKIKDYSNLGNKIKSFKLNYKEINGHDKKQIMSTIEKHFKKDNGATVVLANTVKGKGFSNFESSKFTKDLNFYPYHSGVVSNKLYLDAINEILLKIKLFSKNKKIKMPTTKKSEQIQTSQLNKNLSLIQVYSEELYEFVKKNKKVLVLDADLTKDAGSSKVMLNIPKKFFEFGIAEQDMVSFGSGLAAGGYLPIFHSFSCFLSTRAQEQIFNFCSEKRKGIFVGALSGLTPSAPGHSHQMIRDVPLIGSIPNICLVELFSPLMIKDFFKTQKKISKSIFIKLNNSNLIFENFKKFKLPRVGQLLKISHKKKNKTIIICQGADVLNEILKIKNKIDLLGSISIFSGVWLNEINKSDLLKLKNKKVIMFQSSINYGSFDSFLSKKILENSIKIKKFKSISINQVPKCGQNDEILNYHNLSAESILNIIKKF